MRYGLHVGGGAVMGKGSAAQQIGELAEELGYDGIVTGDHITIPKEIGSTYPYTKLAESMGYNPYAVFTTMDWLDAFTVLGLLVPVTKTVRLGTSVTIVPYRHPLDMARVVASPGRGLGADGSFLGPGLAGCAKSSSCSACRTRSAPHARANICASCRRCGAPTAPALTASMSESTKTCTLLPGRSKSPHPPIWVGGESTPALKRVVEFGAGWHIGPVDIEDVRPRFDELRGLMEAAGRHYDELEITWMVDTTRTDAAAIRAYRDLGGARLIRDRSQRRSRRGVRRSCASFQRRCRTRWADRISWHRARSGSGHTALSPNGPGARTWSPPHPAPATSRALPALRAPGHSRADPASAV